MNFSTTTKSGKFTMSPIFESAVNEIFHKFDLLLSKELSYTEFKGFCDVVEFPITPDDFTEIIKRFQSTKAKAALNTNTSS